jgi:hypothetical protein
MSHAPFVSPGTRSGSKLENETWRPSSEIEAPVARPGRRSARRVDADSDRRGRRAVPEEDAAWHAGNDVVAPRVESDVASVVGDLRTDRARVDGIPVAESTLRQIVVPLPSSNAPFPSGSRSWRKMSGWLPRSPWTRFEASLSKATNRPSSDIVASPEYALACAPPWPTLHADGRAEEPVAHEDVVDAVRVAGDEIRRRGSGTPRSARPG